MAQHIPIEQIAHPRFEDLQDIIGREVARGYLGGSFKYERLPQDYNEGNDTEVFTTSRTIPKDYVYGTTKGTFEVHINNKQVNQIYLVA